MVKILFADQSYIVRKGFTSLLEHFNEVETVLTVAGKEECREAVQSMAPHIVFINTSFFTSTEMNEFKGMMPDKTHILYLFNSVLPDESPANQLSIFESKASLIDKIHQVIQKINTSKTTSESEELSPREKLILKHVALGHTNKAIGELLFISSHTVISHRKNITRKLGIKTVSGLTVYAILNNLIQMEDIN
ncbi:MAG: response regulator transcription factor [Marinilabiliaceae bacterium]|nr:response regulator transcription factor [Marinilabiliaceae bacterium]